MPHKHKAKRDRDAETHDLPPTKIARPLPVGKSQATSNPSNKLKAERKPSQKEYKDDDTPKAFLRLMQFTKTGKGWKGLDNGDDPRGKKRKRTQADCAQPVAPITTIDDEQSRPGLKIQPGERLADFNARVDQALPVGGLVGKRKIVEGIKERQTKHEKKLRKLQSGWRLEEARIRDREAEQRELAEEEEDEQAALYGDHPEVGQSHKRSQKSRRYAKDDEDPWAVLKETREKPKLHDVVQAPPTFKRLPKEKFKTYDGAKADVADIPSAAGSLKRREELGQTRKDIIASYRAMMEEKRKV